MSFPDGPHASSRRVKILNAAYVTALPSATIAYVANVLLHLVLGLAAAARLGLYLIAAPHTPEAFLKTEVAVWNRALRGRQQVGHLALTT